MRELSREFCRRAIAAAKVDASLRLKTDREIADLLLQMVWAELPWDDVRAAIVENAIDRLRGGDEGGE